MYTNEIFKVQYLRSKRDKCKIFLPKFYLLSKVSQSEVYFRGNATLKKDLSIDRKKEQLDTIGA